MVAIRCQAVEAARVAPPPSGDRWLRLGRRVRRRIGTRAYRSLSAIFSLGCFLCDLCAFAVRLTGPVPIRSLASSCWRLHGSVAPRPRTRSCRPTSRTPRRGMGAESVSSSRAMGLEELCDLPFPNLASSSLQNKINKFVIVGD